MSSRKNKKQSDEENLSQLHGADSHFSECNGFSTAKISSKSHYLG